jgi:23S rRNA (uracil1939-C5)-methyltransferase
MDLIITEPFRTCHPQSRPQIDGVLTDLYSGDTMARPRRGESLCLTVDDLAFGGEGVGRADGYVVFVPGGVPGDRVRVRLAEARARFGRGLIEAIEEPSPHRVEAPCPYFGRCGGCRLQHVAYPAQLAFKAKQVADVLERVGGLAGIEQRPIMGAVETYGYRNKMEFTIAPAPAREGGGRAPIIVGLHEAARYDAVLDIERCLLQSEGMNARLDEARRFFVEGGLDAYDQDAGEGLLRFLMLREGRRTGEAMVNVVTASPAVSEMAPLAGRLEARLPGTSSVVMNVNPKKASVAVGVEEHLLGGRDHIRERIGGLSFQISANSFFQTNTEQAERLFDLVLGAAALEGDETVVDLYSGTGAISLLLARRSRWVYGVEVATEAVEDAARNAAANDISNCTFLAGEVRFVLPSLIARGVGAEVVVADPPRAGFHPKALHALIALEPRRIVYVSCNPSTLARDLGDLVRGGYRVEWVQPVDMFPHTPHIEAVARLARDRA